MSVTADLFTRVSKYSYFVYIRLKDPTSESRRDIIIILACIIRATDCENITFKRGTKTCYYTLNIIRARSAAQKSKTVAEIGRLSFSVAAPSRHPSCSVIPIDFVPWVVKGHGFLWGESEREREFYDFERLFFT